MCVCVCVYIYRYEGIYGYMEDLGFRNSESDGQEHGTQNGNWDHMQFCTGPKP